MYNYDPNGNTTDIVANGADTYLSGSNLPLTGRVIPGTSFRWRMVVTKTAAGIATPVFTVRIGTSKSVSDAAVLTFTLAAQTAAIDTAIVEIDVIVRGLSAAGNNIQGVITLDHKGGTAGFAATAPIQIVPALSGAFNPMAPDLHIGISCNPGASAVWTFPMVGVQCQ